MEEVRLLRQKLKRAEEKFPALQAKVKKQSATIKARDQVTVRMIRILKWNLKLSIACSLGWKSMVIIQNLIQSWNSTIAYMM